MNSIKDALGKCPHGVTAEIALILRSHFPDNKLLVVVEGASDKKVYSRFYDSSKFDVYCSTKYSGCLDLPDMLRALNAKYLSRLIAIKDADFDHLNGVGYGGIPNLFLTDTHDLETMMLTEDFYRQLESELGITDAKAIVLSSIHDIVHLSYIKWLNDVSGIKLVFKKVCPVGSCYDGTCCVDIAAWLHKIYSHVRNVGKRPLTVADVEAFESCAGVTNDNLLQLVNGHDMVAAVANKIKAKYKRNCSKETVAGILADSYTYFSYSKTALCSSVDAWCLKVGGTN